MELPKLPTIGFYEKPSSCFNFIHIIQSPDNRTLIRFAEHSLARNHSDVYTLLKKEFLEALQIDDEGLFYNHYHCIGGGYVHIINEESDVFRNGLTSKTKCKIRGSSSTFGAADLDLVKRLIEESGKFDIVTIRRSSL